MYISLFLSISVSVYLSLSLSLYFSVQLPPSNQVTSSRVLIRLL